MFGHISSMGLSKLILEGRANGKSNRVKPKRCWLDDIKAWTGLSYWDSINAIVMDRERWRSLCYDVSYSA